MVGSKYSEVPTPLHPDRDHPDRRRRTVRVLQRSPLDPGQRPNPGPATTRSWASPRIVEASSMMDGCADRGQGLASGGVFGEFFDGDHLLAAWADAASAQALAGS